VHRGSLEDLDSLKRGAASVDGVIHTAFVHDFSNFLASCETDKIAIETLGGVLAGSGRPLIVTSGLLGLTTEDDSPTGAFPRKSEETGLALAARGVRAMVVRLPPSVHGDGDHGFVPALIRGARERGFATYVGDGQNLWSAVHRLDAAHLYRLAIEKGETGARYHGVGDRGIPTKQIAEIIARRLSVPAASKSPEEAAALFGFIGHVLSMGVASSSARTEQILGWRATHVGLIEDLERGRYFDA
jgi:nucleoside-diphosphate-sugar epimerase